MGRWMVGGAAVIGLAAGFGVAQATATSSAEPLVVDLHVAGAQSISVYCAGTTVNTDGTDVTFVAEQGPCQVEAPLTAAMPLKGEMHVSVRGRYSCDRRNDELICARER